MTSSDSSPVRPVTRPAQVAGAIAQLAALGVIGAAVFSLLFSLLGAGIGLLFLLGVGVFVLLALVYVLYGVGWLETQRVEGLYRFGIAAPRPRSSGRPGFGGFLRTVWMQAIDAATWRAIAHLAIATILGWVVVALAGILVSGIVLAFAPLFADAPSATLARTGIAVPISWAVPVGILSVMIAAAGLIGLGVLHGIIARAIMVPSREAQLAAAARTSSLQHAGAVRAADVERTRIERDLHDGVQPRLVSVGMTLGLAQQKIDSDPDAARELIAEAHTSTKAAITELRQLARGIHTSVLDDRGLDAALSALIARSVVPVHTDVRLDGRCSRDTEAAAYFVIAEALTNAAKHSRATEVRVVVRLREPGTLWARVEDNGVGGARVVPGGGLDGIVNRVLAAGGEARIDSPAGGPTSVEVSIPCAS
ncbi:histidine kinase [Microbacterium sp. M3]|uniref:histidine kinase n=1 Tax=Microbacterium arthrosphaerae TaxID=792652 RepID=A0ABU4GYD3_9MICO|nr:MULTISPECIES: histidine kinase [Microbacterium]MDW4572097.1 histidine kinase [Microbacterium arthrosphaerae]MDW7605952.1 histidine kinase [Microbacterium sp. M3]